MKAKAKSSIWVFIIPAAILILLRIPSLFESYWYGDEAIYAAVAQGLLKGKLMYAQIWDHKPPFIFLFFYPAALIGWSKGFILLRLVNILMGLSSLLLISEVLKKPVKDTPRFVSLFLLVLFLGSPILEGNVVNAEVIFMVFNLLALYLLINKKQFLLVGFLGFLSLITKVPGFVEFAVICASIAVIYFREEKIKFLLDSIIKIIIGFIFPIIVMVFIFYLFKILPDLVYANATFNKIYSLSQANYINILGKNIPTTYPSALSLFSVFLFVTILFWKRKISSILYIGISLLAVEGFASLLSGKNYSHYFLQILPALTILIALLMSEFKKIKKIDYILISVVFILFVPMLMVFTNGGSLPVYAEPQEYYPWFLTNREKFWWGKSGKVERFSDYLNTNYLDLNPIYIYTDKPWIEALSSRDIANKYVVWFHLQYRQEHLQEEMENNMSRAQLFALDRDPQLLEPVKNMLDSEFEKIDNFENFDIYIRK